MGEQSAAELSAISKTELERDGSSSSIVSTPEHETEIAQDQAQPQKRKGGRKPIYATSEERKQRNRQAQAAFRERRTEYIKQLEATIKAHEDNLQSLQQSHRNAADECLMLRYKNSLLERILLEKGIDALLEQSSAGSIKPDALDKALAQSSQPGPLSHRDMRTSRMLRSLHKDSLRRRRTHRLQRASTDGLRPLFLRMG
ncbi:hypothetical protein LTR28_008628 [Elasticomyces elasticus]|nr:hypothetical protein LTR28_008628 [Elasticomyces elasticus]